jgi:hypothetical protein
MGSYFQTLIGKAVVLAGFTSEDEFKSVSGEQRPVIVWHDEYPNRLSGRILEGNSQEVYRSYTGGCQGIGRMAIIALPLNSLKAGECCDLKANSESLYPFL